MYVFLSENFILLPFNGQLLGCLLLFRLLPNVCRQAFAVPEIFFFRGRPYGRPTVGVDTVVKAVAIAASP